MIYLRHAFVLLLVLMGSLSDLNFMDVPYVIFLIVGGLYAILEIVNWKVPLFDFNRKVRDKITIKKE